ncbi:MAG: hypothetical protein LBB27_01120, partial [Tannerellaceae bacterium]|nr:hypothetical protein [Tannerellaceae bacterium]
MKQQILQCAFGRRVAMGSMAVLTALQTLPVAGQDYREDYTPTPPVIDPNINMDVPLPTLSPSGGAPFYEWEGAEMYRDSAIFENDPADPPLVTYEMLDGKQGAVINLDNCDPTKHYPTFGAIGEGLRLSHRDVFPYQGVQWHGYSSEHVVNPGHWDGWIGVSSATGEVLSSSSEGTDDLLRQSAFRNLTFENSHNSTLGEQLHAAYLHKFPSINEWALRNSLHISGSHPDVTSIYLGTILLHKVILDNLILPCDGKQYRSLCISTGIPWWATEAAPPIDIELIGTTRLEGVYGLWVGCGSRSYKARVYYDDDADGIPDGYTEYPEEGRDNLLDVINIVEITPPAEYGIGRFTLHGDSLIARFPKTGRGAYYEQGCGKGITFTDDYLTIESCYLEVQGHVQAGKITVKDGVVTAVDPVWIDD